MRLKCSHGDTTEKHERDITGRTEVRRGRANISRDLAIAPTRTVLAHFSPLSLRMLYDPPKANILCQIVSRETVIGADNSCCLAHGHSAKGSFTW